MGKASNLEKNRVTFFVQTFSTFLIKTAHIVLSLETLHEVVLV